MAPGIIIDQAPHLPCWTLFLREAWHLPCTILKPRRWTGPRSSIFTRNTFTSPVKRRHRTILPPAAPLPASHGIDSSHQLPVACPTSSPRRNVDTFSLPDFDRGTNAHAASSPPSAALDHTSREGLIVHAEHHVFRQQKGR